MILENHNVNANEEGENKKIDGHVGVSGQKIKYMLFDSIRSIDPSTHISNGDGVTGDITNDLRSDLGGYMKTEDKSYSNRRTSPIKVGYAKSKKTSDIFEDVFVRFKMNDGEIDKKQNDQRINNKSYSMEDEITFNYQLDCSELSTTKYFNYEKSNHVSSVFYKHVEESERLRRASLFVKATQKIEGFANQSRNAVVNTPNKVFISFSENMGFVKFFDMSELSQKSLKKDMDTNNIRYFIGDDETDYSVSDAYRDALEYLESSELIDLSEGKVKTQEEVAELNNG